MLFQSHIVLLRTSSHLLGATTSLSTLTASLLGGLAALLEAATASLAAHACDVLLGRGQRILQVGRE